MLFLKIINILRRIVCFALPVCLVPFGWALINEFSDKQEAEKEHSAVMKYKPQSPENKDEHKTELPTGAAIQLSETSIKKIANQSILDLQTEKNADIRGWITVDNTGIDYPYVLSHDNEDYVRADLNGNYLFSGTVFEDCRGAGDASGSDAEIEQFEAYVKDNVRRQRDFELNAQDKIIVLSTCNYEYTDAGSVVVAKLTKEA